MSRKLTYSRDNLLPDLSAGLTVGVMLIPQGMAYALIAGLPPIFGLYASLVPLVIYAAFGTSRQLAVGPVAMVSLLVAAAVAPMAGGDVATYVGLALLLALMVGVIQFTLGIARFGFVTSFLSHPVLAGFTSAAALIIGFSQLKHLLGINIPGSHHIHTIVASAAAQLGAIHLPTLAIGAAGIALMIVMRRWKKTLPGALVVVVLSTAAVWLFGLDAAGVKVVGEVPSGLPAPVVPMLHVGAMRGLLPAALTIALVGFMESFAVARVYATRHRYEVNANRELIGLGLANVAGAFFQAFPTTGGFSRTAVNAAAGARTKFAAAISAVVIALTLLFLTPLFENLPQAVLAAIVMVAVSGLIDWKEASFLWRVDRKDFAQMMLTFVATIALGIKEGILVGVGVSLLVVVHQASRPQTVLEGRQPGTDIYRNIERNLFAEQTEGVAVVRKDASLFFGNVGRLRETVRDALRAERPVRVVVLDAFSINRIDSSAVHALEEMIEDLRVEGASLYVAGMKGPVRDALERSHVAQMIGRERFFLGVDEAVEAARAEVVQERGNEEDPEELFPLASTRL